MIYRVLILMLITVFCRAQTPGKTLVFKVRAPATECTVQCKEKFFWLEAENPVCIKIKGNRNTKIKVEVAGGKVMSVKDDVYNIRFTRSGTAAVSVYQITPHGKELIAVKKQEIKNPEIYFCGIRTDSTSKVINLKGCNVYAYSSYYKKEIPVISFEMYYVQDTTSRKKIKPIVMKADTCMITPEMRKTILSFQPKFNYIYLYNIICRVPDGSKRILDPIRLDIMQNTADKKKLALFIRLKEKHFKYKHAVF